MTVNVDWRSIRPLNGRRDKGFEELCSQLARSEVAGRARFVRKGSPDAGVECYAIFGNGSECGWQAKYFLTLGDMANGHRSTGPCARRFRSIPGSRAMWSV